MSKIPRVMLAAGASGSGKTLITCGILQALKERGCNAAAFKCGPDYIDPMFHTTVIGTPSRNLDTFFTDPVTTRYLLRKNAGGADVAVIEGVMGYFDGLGGTGMQASAWDTANVTDTPVVMIVNCKGMSLSALAFIKGFMSYEPEAHIRGVILNQLSPMLYPVISEKIREELGIRPLGYVPRMKDLALESRHLGLVLPHEVEGIREKLHDFAQTLEKTLDLDGLLELAGSAPELDEEMPADPGRLSENTGNSGPVTIAVAKDEAFCFLYQDNLELLERCGARLIFFSPVHDRRLPEADGLLLCGGYPELHLEKLSSNTAMRSQIRDAVSGGMPCMAECGGFMYLQQEMEDEAGNSWPMAGVLQGRAFKTQKLGRFGYITLHANRAGILGSEAGPVRGHEFHYYDTTMNGEAYHAVKPAGKRSWDCICGSETLMAGFPHLYYYSNPRIAESFVNVCRTYHILHCENGN